MNAEYRRESAKIYIFPTRSTKVAPAARDQERPLAERLSQTALDVECGGGWYHDAAIQEAARTSKP